MVTKKLELNIENEVVTKLQTEYFAGFSVNTARDSFLNKDNRTRYSNQLNFYVPEKWNYDMEI